MTTYDFVWPLLLGIVIGWNAHSIVLQIAYRLGIVEYRGRNAAHGMQKGGAEFCAESIRARGNQ